MIFAIELATPGKKCSREMIWDKRLFKTRKNNIDKKGRLDQNKNGKFCKNKVEKKGETS